MAHVNVDKKDRSRNWKGVTFDYDRVLAQESNNYTLHCLSPTTKLLLLSVLELVSWVTRYDEGEETVLQSKVREWYNNAVYELSGGTMFRQNPANACQLQASCDGETWVTVFDYSLCVSSDGDDAIAYQTELDDNTATYDDDISNLTPNWDYDETFPDDETSSALCWAIGQYIDMVTKSQIDQIEKSNEESNFFQDLAVVSGITGALVGFIATAGFFVATAGTGAAALALLTVILLQAGEYDDDDPDLYRDQEVLDDIKCQIYRLMQGQKPTFGNWSSVGLTGETSVYDYVDATMQSEELFMQFFLMTSDMVEAASDLELVDDCLDCLTGAWVATAPLDVATLPSLLSVEPEFGTFVPMNGVQGQCYTAGTDKTVGGVRLTAQFEMNEISFRYNLSNCSGAPPGVQQSVIDGLFGAGGDYEALNTKEFGHLIPGTDKEMGFEGDRQVNDLVQGQIRSCYFNCGGAVRFTRVRVWGTGVCPMDGEDGWGVVYS